MKMGTAPASITVLVCMDVPDAMLVNAHAASNCRATKHKLTVLQTPLRSLNTRNEISLTVKKLQSKSGYNRDFFLFKDSGFFFQTNLQRAVNTLLQKLHKPLYHPGCVYNFINGWVRLWMKQILHLMSIFLSGQPFLHICWQSFTFGEKFSELLGCGQLKFWVF